LQRDQLGTFERAMTEHGRVVRLIAGPPGRRVTLYLLTHPDDVRQVLTGDSGRFNKDTPVFREMAAYLGDGLVTSDGPLWRRQRRVVAPLFTQRRIARYVTAMAAEAKRLADRWTSPSGQRVDLHAEMTEYTLRVVGQALFGTSMGDAIPVLRTTFPVLNERILRRGQNPLRLPRHWPTPKERRTATAQRELYAVVDGIIEQRRHAAADGETGDDLVSLLLAARDPETGQPLSGKEVRDQALIFLLAGHETTSTALTFAGYFLGRHEDVQHRVHEEIDSVLGTALPTAEDIPKLGYTSMVIKEAMRLYPPAHATGRIAVADELIGGHPLPAGSFVIVSPWATHRNPAHWPEPERFDPERFRSDAEARRHRYAYFPFGGGPRVCIGQHFAMAEAVAAIAVLLGACTLRSDPAPPALTLGITLRPAEPVPCLVTARKPDRPV
jgi:cytochrome P450